MRIIDIAVKDITQILRDRSSLLFLLIMPVALTFFMAMAYKSPQVDPDADNRLVLAYVDLDSRTTPDAIRLGEILAASFEDSDAIRLERMTEAEARSAVGKKEVAGALILPAGFSESRLSGGASQLVLLADSASTTGQTLYQALRGRVTQLISAVETANLDVEMINGLKSLSADEQVDEFNKAFAAALVKWQATDNGALVHTQMAIAPKASDPFGGNPYNQSSPGMLVMFAVAALINSAQILVQERRTRTLERMRSTSLSPAGIIGGHFLAMFALTMLQQLLLVTFGQLALGVNYLSAPLGTLVVIGGLSFCIASLGLLIGVAAKEEQQVILLCMAAMFIFSAMGGAWFPLEGAGKTFATLGKLTPAAWAMTGFQNILIRGLDSTSAVLPAVVLLLYAAGFFTLAVWRFKKA